MLVYHISRLKNALFYNRSSKQIIVKNTFWLTSGEVVGKFLLFIITVSLTRYLGVEGYGKFSFAFAYASIFGVFVDFGFNVLASRDISRNPNLAKVYLSNILGMKVVLGVCTWIIAAVVIQFLGKTVEVKSLVYLALIYVVFQGPLLFYPAIIQAYEKMQYYFISRTVVNCILAFFVLCSIWLQVSLSWIIIAYILATLVSNILVGFVIASRISQFSIAFDFVVWKGILKKSTPFFLSLMASTVYSYLDTNLLSIMTSDREVGIYQSAYKIMFVFQTMNVFHASLFPQIAKLWSTDKVKLKKLLLHSIGLSLVVMIPLSLVVPFIAPYIVMLLYGAEFASAAQPLIFLIWAAILSYFIVFGINVLVAADKQSTVLKITMAAMVVNIVFNLTLIPHMGATGSAISQLSTEVFALLLTVFFLKRIYYQ